MANKGLFIHTIIIMMSVFICTSCKSNVKMKTKTQFVWEPSVAAPIYYPVETKYAFVTFGESGRYPIMENFIGTGIGVHSGGVGLDDFDTEGGFDLPNGLDVLWLSYAEKKYYKANIKFSQELQDRILELFRENVYDSEYKKNRHYTGFVVTLLPGGKIWLYLDCTTRCTLVCDSLQGKEVQVSLKDFEKDAFMIHGTTEKLCESAIKDYEGAAENLKKNGIPLNLWDQYAERFRYDLKIVFENEKTILSLDVMSHFSNGELYCNDDRVPKDMQARIKYIICRWRVADTLYMGEFFFDEEEVLRSFPLALGRDCRQKGELIVHIDKYNNGFDIFLQVGDKKYELEETKIHVFRETPENKDSDDDDIFFNNHRDQHSSTFKFIGE